jgi:hypothetical protein
MMVWAGVGAVADMAKIPGFIPTKHPDRIITQIQNNLNNTLTPITKNPILNGNYVTVTFPSTADTDIVVTHNLGNAQNVSWLNGTSTAAANVYLSPNTNNPALNPKPEQQIVLRCDTAGAVVGLHFFTAS